MENDLLKNVDIQGIATKGSDIYQKIKVNYEPEEKGKFLAIEVDSEKAYLGSTSAEALEKARQEHPEKVFYVVKVGFDVAETTAKAFIENRE